jgi:alpha-L-arabinofuranosidase
MRPLPSALGAIDVVGPGGLLYSGVMNRTPNTIISACVLAAVAFIGSAPLCAADDTPIETTVTVDAARTLRTMDPQRLGGTNVAMWYFAREYNAADVRKWMAELKARYIRLPGGSWANGIYWNGNGVRGADGKVDPSKVGPDGYPAVDYSAYAPSFRVNAQTLHPESGDWHGNVDVKTQQDFVKAIPGSEAMVCPNAGSGRPVDAAEWVKWANKTMGYNVRYWEIGNELGGSWEAGTELPFGKGQLTAEMYTRRYNDMANAMRAVDPTIKIGGGAFAEEMIRDCGENVDFVMIHTYPGSITQSEAQMFADIAKGVKEQTDTVRRWIHQYQPQRADQIELAYTEWNLGGGVNNSRMFSGLWAGIFLGELARHGVSIANQWDCFTDLLYTYDNGQHARKSEYYALWLWNNYMGDRLIPARSSNEAIYTHASRSNDAVFVMLINTDREREAKVSVQIAGFTPAGEGELARVTSREYHWNLVAQRPQWSTGPRIEKLKTGDDFGVTLPPFSMTCVRVPDQAKPALSAIARKALAEERPAPGTPELRFVLPSEMYAGDQIRGELLVLEAGSEDPYRGTLAPATLSAGGDVAFDRSQVRLAEDVGQFGMRPAAPGELTITAQSGDLKAPHTMTVKPSVPRPVVFWDFADPRVTDTDAFSSDFRLSEDLAERANRAVARVELPAAGVAPTERSRLLLKVERLPEGDVLKKENIRGVVFDVKTSPDFACEDPDVGVTVVMQSSANWWMQLGDVPLRDAGQWKTHELETKLEEHIKAMPAALNILFILKANKPVRGSVYFDRVGLMVR